MAEVPLLDAVKMATSTPASIIGVSDNKGSLVEGKDADIIVFYKDVTIKTVFVKGNML